MSYRLELQTRDLQILRALFESRLMTLTHLSALFFDDRVESAKKRLQKLCAARYLTQRPRRLYQHAIYQLTNRSIYHLQRLGVTDAYRLPPRYNLQRRMQVSELTLRHELEVLDLRTAIHRRVDQNEFLELLEISTWPLLSQFTIVDEFGDERIIRPDGFFRLCQQHEAKSTEHACFIEIDRSSESLSRLTQRAVDYRQFQRDGGLALWNGRPVTEARRFPFRVLYVLENAERRNNVTEELLRLSPPILTLIWLTTRKEILQNPLGTIWITPREYRDVIEDSEFDSLSSPRSYHYRRHSDRERFVDLHLAKRALL
jgi:hypothetical protein